jgi:hypothetical protein
VGVGALAPQDDVEESGRNKWTEVVINATEVPSEIQSILDALFCNGFGMLVEGLKCGCGLDLLAFHRKGKYIPIVCHHVWTGIVQLLYLSEQV